MVRFGLPHRTSGGNGVGNNGSGTANGGHGRQSDVGLNTEHVVEPPSPTPVSTGFFTLPMWKRRHGRPTQHPAELDEHGQQIRQPAFDKALPPTPPASDEGHQLRATTPRLRSSPSQLSLRTSRPASTMDPDHQPAAVALAQASLGVGLPHVIGRASISSAASEGHAERPVLDRHAAGPSIRRVQSSQRLPPKSDELPLNGRASTVRPDLPVDVTPPRSGVAISRRPSFWKRKRFDSNKSEQPAKEKEPEPTPSPVVPTILPRLAPVSPFDWDSSMASSSSSMLPSEEAALSPPRLVRRASDRRNVESSPLFSASPPTSPSSPRSPKAPGPRRTSRRPSTAGGALDRPRAKSLYVEPSTPQAQDYPMPTPRKLPPPLLVPMPQPDEPPTSQPLPRHRTTSNAPLLRRLSVNLFSFGNSSAAAVSPVIDPRSNQLTSSPVPTISPRNSVSRTSLPPPKPNAAEETPEEYLDRLAEVVPKADVAGVLASSGDDFHTRALRIYVHRFEFAEDSLDVAVRRLLMHVGLPRETQQIDRVMEAFAQRYHQDHRELYKSEDHPYILAFSLIMLHTDAFNKHNKRKMTKADYMKNTRLPGVPSEVLDCFYDNIVFAPFIFIEDPLDRGLASESSSRFLPGMTVSNGSAPTVNNGSSLTLMGKSNKVDPYYLITNNLLKPLRVDVEALGSLQDPFSYHGTLSSFNEEELRSSFAHAGVIEISPEARRTSTSVFAVSVGGFVAIPEAESVTMTPDRDVVLKVANVGLLQRRDIALEGGKRAPARKWREWSVVLTATQMLFFRDSIWATHLQEQAAAGAEQLLMPPSSLLRPDEVLNIKDAVAVHDSSYGKSQSDQSQDVEANTFLLVLKDGRQMRLRTPDEQSMNAWICRINYASAFKSNGIRMRPLGLSGKDVQLMGVAAAKSHLRDMRANEEPAQRVRAAWDARPSTSTQGSSSTGEYAPQLTTSPPSTPSLAPSDGQVHPRQNRSASVAFDAPTAPIIDGAQQFKATFDQVKADLAAGRTPSTDDYVTRPRALSLESAIQPPWTSVPGSPGSPSEEKPSSRSNIVQAKIKALEERIDAVQAELDADLLILRNIAILTPFQRATRDRLHAAAIVASQRVRARRLELARLSCQREVLSDDVLAEARDWRRNKFLALKAATDVLQTRRVVPVSRKLSLHIEEPAQMSDGTPSSLPTHMPETSTNESFHSALEFECDSPANDGGSSIADSPLVTPLLEERMSSSTSSFPFSPSVGASIGNGATTGNGATAIARSHSHKTRPSHSISASANARRHSSDRGSGNHSPRPSSASGHERFVTARESQPEEAEEWHQTRAAKRVSLIKVPSDLRLTRSHRPSPSLKSVQSSDERAAGFVPTGDYVASFLS